MSRYATMFGELAHRDEIAFGAFLMLGDPNRERCLDAIDELVAAGVDFLELGIPFSDPVADGPVIQAAAARAIEAGVTTSDAIALLAAIRTRHPSVPVGVLTYANIVMTRGREEFARSLAEAGVDSLLIADVPALEAAPFAAAAEAEGIGPVLIAAANTPEETLGRIARLGRGYTYVVARKGITGANEASDTADAAALVARLRALQAPPSILGFGISRPEQVAAAADAGAAGVISGSAIVDLLASGKPLAPFVRQMKDASRRRARQNA